MLRTLLTALIALVVVSTADAQSPSIVFSTYIGGAGNENLRDIATDSAGNIYVTGGTMSPDFPTTAGAYDRTFASGGGSLGTGGPMDVFVAKLTPDGRLVWSTLLGGPNYDRAYAIEVDRAGYVYVAGRAGDSFPTTPGVVQAAFAGDVAPNTLYGKQDPFVAKLSPDGSQLVWSTYFGADDAGIIRDFDIDSAGNVYVASPGATRPHPHITPGAFATAKPGGGDMVVAKISADARTVLWASYLGGSGNDGGGPSIRVDGGGSAYVIGTTTSTDLPVTTTAYDRTHNGGNTDFLLARFTPDGSDLVFCTYFGGSGSEDLETHNISIDAAGDLYICGYTSSQDLPVTPGAIGGSHGGGSYDIPLARLSADGSRLVACSYLGGRASEGAQGIAVDAAGNVVVGGATSSDNYPMTQDAVQPVKNGSADIVVSKLSGNLTRLIYSTHVGGSDVDDGRTAWMDADGTFYVAGNTRSNDFPLVAALQSTRVGGEEGVIVKFTAGVTPQDSNVVELVDDCIAEDETSGSVAIRLERSGALSAPLDVTLTYSGTATTPDDYTVAGATAHFDAGAAQAFVPVTINDDGLSEGLETIEVAIVETSDPGTTIGAIRSATVHLIDDERRGTNLLSDPGFENDGAGWQKATNGGRSVTASVSHGGTKSQQMLLSSQFPREVLQTVAVRSGRTYFASGWLRVEGAGAAGAGIEVQWLDASGAQIAQQSVGVRNGTTAWSWLIGCATAPAGADSARFRIYAAVDPDNAGTAWFDDLELLDSTMTPSLVRDEADARTLVRAHGSHAHGRSVAISVELASAADIAITVADTRGVIVASRSARIERHAEIVVDVPAAGAYVYRIVARAGERAELVRGTVITH